MITIDGSSHSGSGTILRHAAVLATLVNRPLQISRIRAKRPKPGLRPQHVQALRACCDLSGGHLEGDVVGSDAVQYLPGTTIRGGSFRWDIGTAGSAVMLGFTVAPLGLFAQKPCVFTIEGGLFQDFAPSAFHLQYVLLPLLHRMGADIRVDVLRPGFVPRGQGRLRLSITATELPLRPLQLLHQGRVKSFRGLALASHLHRERVAERMASRCRTLLQALGHEADLQLIDDRSAVQRGAALLLWAETDTGSILGADRAGQRGRSSESIGEHVVDSLLADLRTGATTDRYVADQLILFAALAMGRTEYVVPGRTEHVGSNLWLIRDILGAKNEWNGNRLRIDGVGMVSRPL
jgi:RNA 3'-terminal phosphate cyclase (ATP)